MKWRNPDEEAPAPQQWRNEKGETITYVKCGPIETYTTIGSQPWSAKVETFIRTSKP